MNIRCRVPQAVDGAIVADVALDEVSQAWVDAVLDLPAFKDWEAAAQAEPWVIPEEELA